jgi:hypothetical protein
MSLAETISNYTYSEDDFDGHRAAPLLLIGEEQDDKVKNTQDRLIRSLGSLAETEISKYANKRVVGFSVMSIIARIHQREALNANSYIRRPHKTPLYDEFPDMHADEIDAICEKVRHGQGTAIENEIARVAFGMESVEYGNLTIVGEKRKQLEKPLWDEISTLVGKDANPDPDGVYRMSVLGFDRDIRSSENVNYGAMRIGLKRLVGTTAHDATVKSRTTAIINMSTETGIDRPLRELFRETAIEATKPDKETGIPKDEAEGLEAVARLPEFQRCVHWLMTTDISEGIVLARNETVYGAKVNPIN